MIKTNTNASSSYFSRYAIVSIYEVLFSFLDVASLIRDLGTQEAIVSDQWCRLG